MVHGAGGAPRQAQVYNKHSDYSCSMCRVAPRPGVGRAGVGPRGGPGAQRPGAPRGAPRHSCHALPRACTPGGPCHPSPMAPAAPHGKPPQNGHPEEEEEEEEGGFIDCL